MKISHRAVGRALLISVALIVTGCAGVDIGPAPHATTPRHPMTVVEARRTFEAFKDDLVQGTSGMVARGWRELRDMRLRSDGIEIAAVWKDRSYTANCPFSKLAPRFLRADKEYYVFAFGECTSSTGQKGLLDFLFKHHDQATVERFADALMVIRTSGPAVAAVNDGDSRRENPSGARDVLAPVRGTSSGRGGLYALDEKFDLNVLDRVMIDPASGYLTLVGRRDERYKGPRIPYLQHLATLLDHPTPELTLNWTPESERRVNRFLAYEETPAEIERITSQWANLFERGQLTPTGRLMLKAMDVHPTRTGRGLGFLGAEIKDDHGARVAAVRPGTPAERAGLRPGDLVVAVNRVDNLPTSEFVRLIRYVGAGGEARIRVVRAEQGQPQWVTVTAILDEAAGDAWQGATSNDLAVAIFRAAGHEQAADVTYWVDAADRVTKMPGEHRGPLTGMLVALGVKDVWDEYDARVRRGEIAKSRAIDIIMERMMAALDDAFRFTGSATSVRTYQDARRRGQPADAAMQAAMKDVERQRQAALRVALEGVWRRRGGVQIPPELVQSTYNIRFDVVPEYRGVDPRSPLARVLLQSDYLGKQLLHTPDLDKQIPRYQTEFAWRKARGSAAREEGTYHMWISVAALDAAQSSDGTVFETRDAKMQFNIRRRDVRGQERATTHTGYEALLTSLYDDFAVQFPVLHELRETAKVAAAAEWLRTRHPDIRLPRAGRETWNGPAQLPGLVFMYVYPPAPSKKSDTEVIAIGGVRLDPFRQGSVRLVKTDGTLAGARPAEPSGSDVVVVARALRIDPRAPMPRPVGWVTPTVEGRAGSSAITVSTKAGESPVVVRPPAGADAALLAWKANDFDAAEAYLRQAIQQAGADRDKAAGHLLMLAQVLKEKGDTAGAVRTLNEALRLAPDHPMLALMLSRALAEEGRLQEAEAELRKYIARDPGNAAAQRLLADLQARQRGGSTGPPPSFTGALQAYTPGPSGRPAIGREERESVEAGRSFKEAIEKPGPRFEPSPRRPLALPQRPRVSEAAQKDGKVQELMRHREDLEKDHGRLTTELEQKLQERERGGGDRTALEKSIRDIEKNRAAIEQQVTDTDKELLDLSVKFPEESAAERGTK